MSTLPRPIHDAAFYNSLVEGLPGDHSGNPATRQVPGFCYSTVMPTPVKDPHLLGWSAPCAAMLRVTLPTQRGTDTDLLAGNLVTPSMKPFAARYGGHQFGSWAGQLGDGRAISLGEIEAADGSPWEIQLKGAGPTPYSRRADGRAVLRSSLREFVCSEAMHHLGVPTTRALSLVGTGDLVVRDMFYDGNPREEPGAVVARVAPTFIRFGNFEILASLGEVDNLRTLANYVVQRHYPHLGSPSEEAYVAWFDEVCKRTAVMIAHWMTVGFVHGVMNTDNMSILGVTIDYGPYGWLEPYEPGWTPNTTDFREHRYAFGRQPGVALWNLAMLGRSLSPLVSDKAALGQALETYRTTLAVTYSDLLAGKLGLSSVTEDDALLLDELPAALGDSQADLTLFFRKLSHLVPELTAPTPLEPALFQKFVDDTSYVPTGPEHKELRTWIEGYQVRLRRESRPVEEIQREMLRRNPKYVLRNYLAQYAIDAAEQGDLSVLERLMKVLEHPFDERPEHNELAAKRPEWARTKPGCATLSCSS